MHMHVVAHMSVTLYYIILYMSLTYVCKFSGKAKTNLLMLHKTLRTILIVAYPRIIADIPLGYEPNQHKGHSIQILLLRISLE